MTVSLHDVDADLNWAATARLLELPCPNEALPVRSRCPVCAGRLNVYNDSTSEEHWHHCLDCGIKGKMFALVAAAWQLSPQSTRIKLRKLGMLPGETGRRTRPPKQNSDCYDRLWTLAQSHMITSVSPELARLKSRLRLRSALDPDRWLEGPGQLVGAYPVAEVGHLLGLQAAQVFYKGARRDEFLIFPFHTVPERVGGLLFVGREGGPADRFFRLRDRNQVNGDIRDNDIGLHGVHTAARPGIFGATVFAVHDPALAVRLQIRHAMSSLVPLPLVAWHDDGRHRTGGSSWQMLGRRQVVFWGMDPTAQMLHQAMICNGHIATVHGGGASQEALDHYLRLKAPMQIFQLALSRARPWHMALRRWAARVDASRIEELLIALEGLGGNVTEAARHLGPVARELSTAPRQRSARVGPWMVTESAAGWIATVQRFKEPRLISDAIIRVLKIMPGEKPQYECQVLFGGYTVPLTVPFDDTVGAAKRLARRIVRACMKAGAGHPRVYPLQHCTLLEIALAFHAPETVPGKPGP